METVLGMTDLQIRLFTAVAQVGMAAMVGYIAYQQWQTARKKLKADLFDRRFAAYRDLVTTVNRIVDAEPSPEDGVMAYGITDFLEIDRIGSEMAWLFEEAIAQHVVRELGDNARSVSNQLLDLAEAKNPYERMELRKALTRGHESLLFSLKEVTKKVTPYLELQH